MKLVDEYIKKRGAGISLAYRLDDIQKTIQWWRIVGCEVCFVVTGRGCPDLYKEQGAGVF